MPDTVRPWCLINDHSFITKSEGPKKQEEEDAWIATNLIQVTFDFILLSF